MLTRADADLVGRDRALPGLAMLLDADVFLELLKRAVPGVPLSAARPMYVRYKPGTNCLVSYEVMAAGAQIHVHAKAYTIDRRPLLRPPKRPSVRGPLGDGRFVIDEPAIEISVFPNDQKLRAERLWDMTARDEMIQSVCPDRPELWQSRLEVLAYKPERRCVALLTGRNGDRAIVKAYTTEGYERAQAAVRAFRLIGAVGIPQELGRSTAHRLLIFQWLPGDPLADRISRAGADMGCVRLVGGALATLHGHSGAGLESCTRVNQRETLLAVARGIGALRPELADRAERLARLVATRVEELSTDERPIHGDFYAGQVLIAANTVNIIDLDRAGRGDPRMDLGNFVAHLECDALDGRIVPGDLSSLTDALIQGYDDAAHISCRSGIEAFIAAGLFGLAPRPFRTRDAEWAARTAAILDRAESLLTSSARVRRGCPELPLSVSDPFDTLKDRTLSLPSETLDPAAVERRLAELPAFRDGRRSVRVCAIRVSRHKPGRRCLIEYDLLLPRESSPSRTRTLVAKARAKGADARTYRLVQRLWHDGFNQNSADGISVPEPVGLLPEMKMWVQWKAPGISAMELLKDGNAGTVVARAATAACKLHDSSAPLSRRHTTDDELRILRERLDAVAVEIPHWRRRLQAVFEASARVANSLPATKPRRIHRDFHPGQILVDDERVYLLDLDLYAAGDPALDIGNFIAHITEFSIRAFADPDRLAACEAALTEQFLASTPDISARSIDIYKTLSLARHIHISRLFPDRRAFTERILDVCEARLGLAWRDAAGRPCARDC